MALRDMEITEDKYRHLARALEIDPSNLEALSVRAAVRFLADDSAATRRQFVRFCDATRRFSRMYSIIGEYAESEHRYPDRSHGSRSAAPRPEDAYAHATLGLNLLRMGDEQNGLAALRQAWERDRFNVHVYNTLNLYDNIIARQFVDVQAAPLTLRMHREERPILQRYAAPFLRDAYRRMKTRYGFEPEGPVRIEMYADLDHFSVRTSGLPSLGVQGVCFGKVVTALSPRGGDSTGRGSRGTSWRTCSTFSSRAITCRIRSTEGLAEYETIIARPSGVAKKTIV